MMDQNELTQQMDQQASQNIPLQLKRLMDAIKNQDIAKVEAYLNPDTVNGTHKLLGRSSQISHACRQPLLYAIFKRNLTIVKMIVEAGATITDEALSFAAFHCFYRPGARHEKDTFLESNRENIARLSDPIFWFLIEQTKNYNFFIEKPGEPYLKQSALSFFLDHNAEDFYNIFLQNGAKIEETLLITVLRKGDRTQFLALFNAFANSESPKPIASSNPLPKPLPLPLPNPNLKPITFKLFPFPNMESSNAVPATAAKAATTTTTTSTTAATATPTTKTATATASSNVNASSSLSTFSNSNFNSNASSSSSTATTNRIIPTEKIQAYQKIFEEILSPAVSIKPPNTLSSDAKNKQESTILFWVEITKLLLSKGLPPNGRANSFHSNSTETYLHRAVTLQLKEIAELLIAAGADVNSGHSYTNSTPLMHAAANNDEHLCQLLIKHKAHVFAKTSNEHSSSLASYTDSYAIKDRLPKGATALDYAASNSGWQSKSVSLLLDAGFPADAIILPSNENKSKLPIKLSAALILLAIQNQDVPVVQKILAKKPNLNVDTPFDLQAFYALIALKPNQASTAMNISSASNASSASSSSSASSASTSTPFNYSSVKISAQGVIIDNSNPNDTVFLVYPLSLSVLINNINIARLLVNAAVTTHDRQWAIWMAAKNNSKEMLDLLLRSKPNFASEPQNRNWTFKGLSPLDLALSKGAYSFAKQLIDADLYIQHTDKYGNTALRYAALSSESHPWPADIIRSLLNKGADPNTIIKESPQETITHFAIRAIDEETVTILMSNKKCDFTPKIGQGSVLSCTLQVPNLKFLELFLSLPVWTEYYKQLDLYYAVYIGNMPGCELLLKHTSNVAWDHTIPLVSPLILAIQQKKTAFARALIKAGRYLAWKDANLEGALIHAIKASEKEIVEDLLKLDSTDCTSPNINGVTPLHFASQCPDSSILKLLIAKKVELSVTDNSKRSALMYALSGGYFVNANILIDSGININLISSQGENALFNSLLPLSNINYNNLSNEKFTVNWFEEILRVVNKLLKKGCFIDGNYQPTPGGTFIITIPFILTSLRKVYGELIGDEPQLAPNGSLILKPDSNNIWTSLENYKHAKSLLATIIDLIDSANTFHCDLEKAKECAVFYEMYLINGFSRNLTEIVNTRRIKDGKTALHIALQKKLYSLLEFLLMPEADVTLVDNAKQTVLELMNAQLRAFRKLYQEIIPQLTRIHSTLEKAYAALETAHDTSSTALKSVEDISKNKNKYHQNLSEVTQRYQKEIADMAMLAKDCLAEIQNTYGDKENEKAFALLRAKICYQLSPYFYNSVKARPWYDANFARKALSTIHEASPLYKKAQHQLFLLESHAGDIHDTSLDDTHIRNKLLHYVQSIHFEDKSCKDEDNLLIKNSFFSKYLAHYMAGKAQSIAGIPNVTGLNSDSLLAVFDWVKTQFQEKDDEIASLSSELKKEKDASSASTLSPPPSTNSAILYSQYNQSQSIYPHPSTAYAASAASSSTASIVQASTGNISNDDSNTGVNHSSSNNSSTVGSPRKRKLNAIAEKNENPNANSVNNTAANASSNIASTNTTTNTNLNRNINTDLTDVQPSSKKPKFVA